MKWRPAFEWAEWEKRPLPKTFGCKYCSDRRRVPVKYMFDAWKGWDKGVSNEEALKMLKDMSELFQRWLQSTSNCVKAMVVCTKCGYHLLPLEICYTDEEKDVLRTRVLPTEQHVVGSIYWSGASEELIIKAVFLPRGFKRMQKGLEPIFD